MKKKQYLILVLMLMVIIVLSYFITVPKTTDNTIEKLAEPKEAYEEKATEKYVKGSEVAETITQEKPSLDENEKVTTCDNFITMGTYIGDDKNILLRLYNYEYEENWSTEVAYSEAFGRRFKGNAVLVLTDNKGREIHRLEIKDAYTFECEFDDFFNIEVRDYNADGYSDFNIGQKKTNDLYTYHVFTVRDDKIEKLTKDKRTIPSQPRGYSTVFETDEKNILTSFYSKADGEYVNVTTIWNGDMYIRPQ